MRIKLLKFIVWQCWAFAVLSIPTAVLGFIHAGWSGVFVPALFLAASVISAALFEDSYRRNLAEEELCEWEDEQENDV